MGNVEFNKKKIKQNCERIDEIIQIPKTTLDKRDVIDYLDCEDRFDLLKKLERNIFQQEIALIFKMMKSDFSDIDWYWHGRGKLNLKRNHVEGSKICHIGSEGILLTLNTLRG